MLLIKRKSLEAIANGFRQSRGSSDKLTLEEMATLAAEPAKADPVLAELTVSENGLYVPGEGVDGFNSVTVNVADSGADTEEIDDLLDEINGEFIAEAQYTFTFIGASGEFLCEVPVYETQDCDDPITSGIIQKPTKESTPQYSYAYSHWSPTEGGSADSSIFQNVTEDRTVYAVFTATVRSYTIRYYDGETLKKSVTFKYGTMPTAYTLEKQGYSFEGWEPEVTTVTGEASYYATWSEKPSFAGSTWADIAEISASGKAAETFYLGDRKTIVLSNADGSKTETMEVEICNFDDDGRMDIGTVDVVQTMFGLVNLGFGCDYANSPFVKTYAPLIENYLPPELKNVLVEHTRLWFDQTNDVQKEITGKIFIPSRTELDGSYSYRQGTQGTYDGTKFGHYTFGKSYAYQLRTWTQSGAYHTLVQPDGSITTKSTDTDSHFAFIFKV